MSQPNSSPIREDAPQPAPAPKKPPEYISIIGSVSRSDAPPGVKQAIYPEPNKAGA